MHLPVSNFMIAFSCWHVLDKLYQSRESSDAVFALLKTASFYICLNSNLVDSATAIRCRHMLPRHGKLARHLFVLCNVVP